MYGIFVCATADASPLRQTSHNVLRGGVSAKDSAAHKNVATHTCQNPPCPCLVTPAPYVTADDLQASQILLAADTAMARGVTVIGLVADQAGDNALRNIKDVNTSAVQKEAKGALAAAEMNATAQLGIMLHMESERQTRLEKQMEVDAKNAATFNAAHMKATSEEWAKNQALHYMAAAADQTMSDAVMATEMIPKIRQQATEQTKAAIDASAEALAVAQRAQAMALQAPKELILEAHALSGKTMQEQEVMNLDIERVAARVKEVGEEAHSSHDLALATLAQAMADDSNAKKALESAQLNAEKIKTLQENTQTTYNEAAELR